jgi:hypothetical protein
MKDTDSVYDDDTDDFRKNGNRRRKHGNKKRFNRFENEPLKHLSQKKADRQNKKRLRQKLERVFFEELIEEEEEEELIKEEEELIKDTPIDEVDGE